MSIGDILFSFEGRVRRTTFWMVIIPLFLIGMGGNVLILINNELAGLAVLLAIPIVWINLAIYVKRWHDLNMSGWMTLTLFIPFVNLLLALFLGLAPGTSGPNKYGRDPRQLESDGAVGARCPECGVVASGHMNWCPDYHEEAKKRAASQ
jgi:uncharacterized membrane protein YhaH (DUF805 family)